MQRTVSMFWAMYKWQIMLIYCMSYIGFGKNLLADFNKSVSRTTTTYKVQDCVKNDGIQAFSNPYFPIFGQNQRKYGLEKARIWIWAYFMQESSL